MAQHSDYIPRNKYEFETWAVDFVKTSKENIGSFGITDKKYADLKKMAEDLVNGSVSLEKLMNEKLKQVKITQAFRKKLEDACRATAQNIKTDAAYTEAVGRDFDIIGAENPFDPKTFKTVISLRRVSSGVEVSFEKSETEGINLYRRIEGETNWQYMARDTHSPYIDTKEMDSHATYEYMAWAVIKDKEIGLESDIASITV